MQRWYTYMSSVSRSTMVVVVASSVYNGTYICIASQYTSTYNGSVYYCSSTHKYYTLLSLLLTLQHATTSGTVPGTMDRDGWNFLQIIL